MALGNQGLCGGQSLEFEVSHALLGAAEGGPAAVLTREYVESCHSMKTASLFAMAAEAGALAVGAPRPEAFGRIGHKLGLAFQLADDLIDACGHQQEAGKPVQRDHVLGRPNAVLAVGEESVRKQARALLADAWASLRAELKESTLLDAWLGDLIASLVPGSAR
jgi:geranylgeranyl pyrophosphate synthase